MLELQNEETDLSQNETILAHLQAGNTITPAEAYALCGSLALHSRIAELRRLGYPIDGRISTRDGKRWGVYRLRGGEYENARS